MFSKRILTTSLLETDYTLALAQFFVSMKLTDQEKFAKSMSLTAPEFARQLSENFLICRDEKTFFNQEELATFLEQMIQRITPIVIAEYDFYMTAMQLPDLSDVTAKTPIIFPSMFETIKPETMQEELLRSPQS